ncbi:hypothetical protein [Herbaspirillum sp. B65]|uniref:hypothetical protein n=2 Tax=Pseudomonadota TaxID=1224 RepID=UPI0005CA079D|nr:hypothetical protein [Herbaspirillum sp. B65]
MSLYTDAKAFATQEIEKEKSRKREREAELQRQQDEFVSFAKRVLDSTIETLEGLVQEMRADKATAVLQSGFRRDDGYFVDFKFQLSADADPVQTHYAYTITLGGSQVVNANVVGVDEVDARNMRIRTDAGDPNLVLDILAGVKKLISYALIKGNSLL